MSDAFYKALAQRESGGDPRCVNSYGFMGLYQMGQPALQDVGYMTGDETWTGKDGIHSQNDFLSNADVQAKAVREYHEIVWSRYLSVSTGDSVGRNIKGIEVTKSGLIAAAHLVGHGGIDEFL